jgi:hypothetical protein
MEGLEKKRRGLFRHCRGWGLADWLARKETDLRFRSQMPISATPPLFLIWMRRDVAVGGCYVVDTCFDVLMFTEGVFGR